MGIWVAGGLCIFGLHRLGGLEWTSSAQHGRPACGGASHFGEHLSLADFHFVGPGRRWRLYLCPLHAQFGSRTVNIGIERAIMLDCDVSNLPESEPAQFVRRQSLA